MKSCLTVVDEGFIMQPHPVVSRDEWLIKRRELLMREKEAIHLRDAINAERQALPWVRVDTQYVFDTPDGKKTLDAAS